MSKIKVHEKALAHLSRGLYRSPASALRELVSNAWDANAKIVRISTNYPLFHQVSIEDDGEGFTKKDFESLMEGGVGNSEKRLLVTNLVNGRPLIGRLGIGMLGIAQICGSFTITSKPKHGDPFRARLRLYDFLKERLDKDDKGVVVTKPTDGDEIDIVHVGEYDFEYVDPEEIRPGTTIVADDVHPTFISTFRKSLKFEHFREPPLDWSKAVKFVSRTRSLQELGDYWRLLWELSVACPLPYLSDNALPKGLITADQKVLLGYDFRVLVDNIQLSKPILLRGNKNGYTTHKIEPQKELVYSKKLAFHGYVIVQEGAQLRPDEMRGILIRIRNVAIGFYDASMLDYRYNEGPRSRWLTGEIFVDDGLEDALNIDRDSFNRFHPEFRTIQEYIHRILHEEVFPATYKQIDVRSTERTKTLQKAHTSQLKKAIKSELQVPVTFSLNEKSESDAGMPAVTLAETADGIKIGIPPPDSISVKKSNRQLASAILAIYEVALREKSRDKQRELFNKLLMSLLSNW